MTRPILVAVALLALGASTAAARFHARLVKAIPAVDGVIQQAPSRMALTFSEKVTPRLTRAELVGADSTALATVSFSPTADSLTVAGPVAAALKPGAYLVRWRSMSTDGHAIRGEYRFRLTP